MENIKRALQDLKKAVEKDDTIQSISVKIYLKKSKTQQGKKESK